MTSNVASTVIAAAGSQPRPAAAAKLEPVRRASAAVAGGQALTAPSFMSNNVLVLKNKLLCDLTHAIQMAQKLYLERNDSESRVAPLTNSDYQVHELCQQFDFIFLYG